MEALDLVGYLCAVLIGFSLGLIGGGGSVLTVPVLVYLFHIDVVLSTAYSLFVVGVAAAIGSVSYMRNSSVCYRTALVFGLPAIFSVFITRKFIMPAIPDPIFSWGSLVLSKNTGIMLLFAVLMIFAAVSMIRGGTRKLASQAEAEQQSCNRVQEGGSGFRYGLILLEGFTVGGLTGLVGAGGGFMIVPALVVLAHIPMKLAIGTSLLIISAKSLLGFMGDIDNQGIEWHFLTIFTALAIAGIYLGTWLSKRVSAQALRKTFGYFIVLMGIYVLYQELM